MEAINGKVSAAYLRRRARGGHLFAFWNLLSPGVSVRSEGKYETSLPLLRVTVDGHPVRSIKNHVFSLNMQV
jgi:hypothetical protein